MVFRLSNVNYPLDYFEEQVLTRDVLNVARAYDGTVEIKLFFQKRLTSKLVQVLMNDTNIKTMRDKSMRTPGTISLQTQ